MRIFIVNAVYDFMSTGRTYKELHDCLVAKGHECEVFYGNRRMVSPEAHYMGSHASHKLHALCARITGKRGGYSTAATRKLIQYMERKKPDVVHLGNLHGNFINIPLLLEYLAEKNIPTSLTLHDCFFFTGGCVYYTLKRCQKWKTLCDSCPYFRENGSWFRDRSKLLHKSKIAGFRKIPRLGVIGVSDWITNEARQAPAFSNAKICQRVYNWVDLEKFKPITSTIRDKHQITSEHIVLGVSSFWSDGKGLSDFMTLADLLGKDYRVILVGKMAKRVTLPHNVISVPPTNSTQELAQYYSGSDVFVHLSKEETFGKVTAEALACGTPAVVFDSTASPELVTEGCGMAVSPSAGVEEFAQCVQAICESNQTAYSQNCRARAEQSFNKDLNIQGYINIYEKLCSEE